MTYSSFLTSTNICTSADTDSDLKRGEEQDGSNEQSAWRDH